MKTVDNYPDWFGGKGLNTGQSFGIVLEPNLDFNDCGKTPGLGTRFWPRAVRPWFSFASGILVSSSVKWVVWLGWVSRLPRAPVLFWHTLNTGQADSLLFRGSRCWMGLTCTEGRLVLDFPQRWKLWWIVSLGLPIPQQKASEQFSNCWEQNWITV